MTDQLEHELRTLLTQRATAVIVDPTSGERAIAERLRTGDDALATVLPLAGQSHRARWVVAAAAAVALVIGVAVVLQDRDAAVDTVQPGPGGEPTGVFEAAGSAEDVARAYLVDRLALEPGDLVLEAVPPDADASSDLRGVTWSLASPPDTGTAGGTVVLRALGDDRWEVVESFSDGPSIDSIALAADGAHLLVHASGGTQLNLSAHSLDGEDRGPSTSFCGVGAAIVSGVSPTSTPPTANCEIEIELTRLPATVRLVTVLSDGRPATLEERLLVEPEGGWDPAPSGPATTQEDPAGAIDDPTVGAPGDSAKDVAERVALAVFGEEYVTMGVTDVGGTDAVTVTMQGPGGPVDAEVTFDQALQRPRVLSIVRPGLDSPIGVLTEGELVLQLPQDGTVTVTGLDAQLEPIGFASAPVVAGEVHLTDTAAWLGRSAWVWMSLETPDGAVLQSFDRP